MADDKDRGRARAADDAPPASAWRYTLRRRVGVAAALFALCTAGIEARLVYLQILQHDDLRARADRQHNRVITAPAKRGEILDRNGRPLASSVDVDTIYADPTEVEDAEAVAAKVCAALDACDARGRQEMLRQLRRRSQFAFLARKVSPEEAERVRELKLKGVAFLKESRRFYPKKELAAHVLGYVGMDNTGLAGLESTYDAQIRGREGKILVQTDARQKALHSRVDRPPTAGASLELTVDQYLQHIAERELQAGIEENRAAGGTVLVMDPFSGEILALANWPTFNPNAFGRFDQEWRRNRAIQDLYEPGSTFKVVTASAALEEDVIGPADPIDCAPGHIRFGSRVIRDVHTYGVLSFNDVIVKSSNVGAIKVGLRLGPERLGRYVSRFGFGQAIGPDFPGENPGIVWNPARLDQSALASISMGYQVGVTPLQMAAAVSSVANGGTLIQPRVVRAWIKDGRRVPVTAKVLRKTISAETAADLTGMMEAVVQYGTGKQAQIAGYTVAGKTGTAAKLVDRRYSKSEYNASFVGFVPSRQPALTIIVVIDTPRARGYYGGGVAAPIFRRVAEASLRHLGIGPTLNGPPPVLAVKHVDDALAVGPRAVRDNLRSDPGSQPHAPALVDASLQAGRMPDVRGRSAREALRVLSRLGVAARLNGQGFVVRQSPEPGEPLVEGDVTVLTLERRTHVSSTGGETQ